LLLIRAYSFPICTLSHTPQRARGGRRERNYKSVFGYILCWSCKKCCIYRKNAAAVLVSKLFIRKCVSSGLLGTARSRVCVSGLYESVFLSTPKNHNIWYFCSRKFGCAADEHGAGVCKSTFCNAERRTVNVSRVRSHYFKQLTQLTGRCM